MTEKVRAFICINFPDEIIKEITRVQSLINLFTGKLTEPENLHLTLKFLGDLDAKKLTIIQERLQGIKFPKLNTKLKKTGTFSFKKEPKIIWIKITGLNNLQKEIDKSLRDLFPEEKKFMGHTTIARVKFVKDKIYFKKHIENLPLKKINFEISKFYLKKSELTPQGPIYTEISSFQHQ